MNDVAQDEYKWVGTRPPRPDGVDKVTGRAKFGADAALPNMLVGGVLRSPHAHAIIKSIDTSKAEALAGVKAVVTRDDFQDMPSEMVPAGEMMVNYRDMVRNVMAREKALYDGHAVAAVAATSASQVRRALALIEVDYEVLPHVIDVMEAMKPDAPLLHDDIFTEGVEPVPDKPSNVAKRIEIGFGDMEAGFAAAAEVIERSFDTQPVHQGYIEPHACLADVSEDGQAELWCTTQGHYLVRAHCARLLQMDISQLRVTASEIGGGFGGKTVVYGEPVALALSRKACRPVKLVMTRDEVFRSTGPTSGARVRVKLGAAKDGTITAAEAELFYQAGAFQGSSVQPAAMCAFAPYALEAVKVVGWDVVSNRPKIAAYRAPGAPISVYAVECVLDEMAAKLGLDPVDFRLKNAAKEGTRAAYGPKFGPIGMVESLEAAKAHAHYQAPLGPNQGRGVASGFWFNIGGETCVSLNLNEDGTLNLLVGTPDIGGSRASMAMMAAEELGVEMDSIRPMIGDTGSLGFNFLAAGSRTTFSTGMATVEAARTVIEELRRRAAKIWEIDVDAVVWEDGCAKPAGSNAGEFEPLGIADLAKQAGATGGPIAGHAEINAQGAGPSLGTQIVDVEVDRETGRVTVLRHTVIQDAGKAIHPSYVEGQYQGGAAQCIGWALNEEYVYGEDGRLENPGFLDYRIPVASDLPMIDTVIVEVPNPKHPYGVRGVGETPIIPGIAAVANAVSGALGIRLSEIPMSPPRVLKAIEQAG
ncbi:MAG: xanthine dehydrogenase family protein molybdopterin-binding subunit [Alphaproteobacteria bacterium]|jgi:CO/xanthine dehydrogenase Mo-binding subunit|nr:oxidoreductase [Rhodospirillaceae bacterium]MDP6406900.1 xanthine dehydrogenase family protein molybdopterin-binding subunit [Alphaproteobacteria bacterium]MDP6622973.1 xanthine dehydrogenase family protein molybdopterin-binding subunit [Alphaproteobacteria bacterium]